MCEVKPGAEADANSRKRGDMNRKRGREKIHQISAARRGKNPRAERKVFPNNRADHESPEGHSL